MASAYDILRAREDATEDELKRAYRHALAAAHPDRHQGNEAPAQVVNRAWNLVSTPEARARYDARLRASRASTSSPGPAPAPTSTARAADAGAREFAEELFRVGVEVVAERLGPEGSDALGRVVSGLFDMRKASRGK